MAKKDNDITLDIDVKIDDAIKKLKKLQSTLQELSKEQTQLKKDYKDGKIGLEEYELALGTLDSLKKSTLKTIRMYTQAVREANLAGYEYEKAIKTLTSELKSYEEAYEKLSKQDKEGTIGEGLSYKMDEIKVKIQEATAAQKDYTDRLGKSQDIIFETIGLNEGFGKTLLDLSKSATTGRISFQAASTSVKAFGNALKGLATNPMFLAITAITLLVKLYKLWKEEQDKLNKVQNKFQESISQEHSKVKILFDGLKNATKGTKEYANIKQQIIDKYGKYLDGQKKEIRNLEDQEAAYKLVSKSIIESSRVKALNTAQEDAANKFTKSWTEALNGVDKLFIKKYGKKAGLEKFAEFTDGLRESGGVLTDELKKIYNEFTYTTIQQTSSLGSYTTLTMNELALSVHNVGHAFKNMSSEVEYANLIFGKLFGKTEESNGVIGIQQQKLKKLEEEYGNIANLNEADLIAYNKKKQAIELEISRLRGLGVERKSLAQESTESTDVEQQAAIDLAKFNSDTEIQKQRDIFENQEAGFTDRLNSLNKYYGLQKAAIEAEESALLSQEKLTKSQIDLINKEAKEKQLALDKEFGTKALQIMVDEETQRMNVLKTNIDNKLATVKKGSEEELTLLLQQLDIQRQAELDAAEKTGADKKAINDKYRAQEQAAVQKHLDYWNQQAQTEYQNQILQAQQNGENVIPIKIAAKEAELAALTQLEGESDADYKNRKLTLQGEIKQLNDDLVQHQIDNETKYMQAVSSIAGSFSDLFSSLAEDNAAFAGFAKAMALYQIGLDTTTALVSGIAAAQKAGPFPKNLVAIATTVAAVLSNIVKAKKHMTEAKEPKAPKFAEGGLITGPGSGTSDSISARLSNGESVLTARATSMFSPVLSAFNQIGGGVPISTQGASSQVMGEEMLSRAFARAVQSMPNPVVSVQEIDNVNNRVNVLENSRRL